MNYDQILYYGYIKVKNKQNLRQNFLFSKLFKRVMGKDRKHRWSQRTKIFFIEEVRPWCEVITRDWNNKRPCFTDRSYVRGMSNDRPILPPMKYRLLACDKKKYDEKPEKTVGGKCRFKRRVHTPLPLFTTSNRKFVEDLASLLEWCWLLIWTGRGLCIRKLASFVSWLPGGKFLLCRGAYN